MSITLRRLLQGVIIGIKLLDCCLLFLGIDSGRQAALPHRRGSHRSFVEPRNAARGRLRGRRLRQADGRCRERPKIGAGDVIVIHPEGPKGGPGMSGVPAKYMRLVSPASVGAITDRLEESRFNFG